MTAVIPISVAATIAIVTTPATAAMIPPAIIPVPMVIPPRVSGGHINHRRRANRPGRVADHRRRTRRRRDNDRCRRVNRSSDGNAHRPPRMRGGGEHSSNGNGRES